MSVEACWSGFNGGFKCKTFATLEEARAWGRAQRGGEVYYAKGKGATMAGRRRRARKSSRRGRSSAKSAYRKGYKAGLRKARKSRSRRRRSRR